jgi:hypothetical protein
MKYHYITYVLAFLIALTGVSALSMVGGTTYSIGNYTYHVFTSNNTLNVTGSGTVAIMVLAGGGGGGGGISGGGGAGGFYNNPTTLLWAQAALAEQQIIGEQTDRTRLLTVL